MHGIMQEQAILLLTQLYLSEDGTIDPRAISIAESLKYRDSSGLI
jgi:hypothetical protein